MLPSHLARCQSATLPHPYHSMAAQTCYKPARLALVDQSIVASESINTRLGSHRATAEGPVVSNRLLVISLSPFHAWLPRQLASSQCWCGWTTSAERSQSLVLQHQPSSTELDYSQVERTSEMGVRGSQMIITGQENMAENVHTVPSHQALIRSGRLMICWTPARKRDGWSHDWLCARRPITYRRRAVCSCALGRHATANTTSVLSIRPLFTASCMAQARPWLRRLHGRRNHRATIDPFEPVLRARETGAL